MTANANVVELRNGSSTLVRPKFSPGLLLRDDDLKVGVDYTRELSRLLFQSLFGCGVVCGLRVETAVDCGKLIITVRRGVALNGIGDPIYVPKDTTVTIDPTCGKPIPDEMWVILCRTEKCCAPRSAVCGCEDDDSASVCTREQEWFEIRLVNTTPGDCVCKCAGEDLPARREQASQADVDAKAAARKAAGRQSRDANLVGAATPDCACVDPCHECYKDHYAGECSCECCEGDCVVLAVLRAPKQRDGKGASKRDDGTIIAPEVNHSVRRFVRPVLMRDPVVWLEQHPDQKTLCPEDSDSKRAATAGPK